MHYKNVFCEFLIFTFVVTLNAVLASTKCGLVPNQVFLKRGERKQLIFWTDQNYDATSEKPGATNQEEQVDLLLQLVNGAMPKPEQIFNIHEEEETYPQFQGVSSTTTTTTSTTTQTTTPKTTTTTVIPTEDTTTNNIVEDELEVEDADTTTTPSLADEQDLVAENTGELSSTPNDSVETTLSSLVNDIEGLDNEADIAPSTTEILSTSEALLETGTTLPTILEENIIDTVTPLMISQNAEEIVEIVEHVNPSQLMEGPTPSIIIAEIVKPEEMGFKIDNKTDPTTTTQNELENDTTTQQPEFSSTEQHEQVHDLPDYTLLETNSEVEEGISTTQKATTLFSNSSPLTTIHPLLIDSSEELEESKPDIENNISDEITESKTTISNIDGFHITISNPIKQESKTEPPLVVVEVQNTNESSTLNDTQEDSEIGIIDEEDYSQTTIISTTDKNIDDSTSVHSVVHETTTENLENTVTETNFVTDKITTVAPVKESAEELLPLSIEIPDQNTIPPGTTAFEQGNNNSLPSTTVKNEIIQNAEILDDDADSGRNTTITDELGENEIQSSFENNDVENAANLVATTGNDEEIVTDPTFSEEETSIKDSDTVITITEVPTTTELLEKELLNEQNDSGTKMEVPASTTTISNVENIEDADITTVKPSTISQESVHTKQIEQESATSQPETITAAAETTTNEAVSDYSTENLSPVIDVATLDEVLFDDPDDGAIPQDETSTFVPAPTLQENDENKNETSDIETESANEKTTTNPSSKSKTESIFAGTTTEEASTIKIPLVESVEVEEIETKPLIIAPTSTEASNILLEEFKPSTNVLENQESDNVRSSNTTMTITTIPSTTVLGNLSTVSSELEVIETKSNETIEKTNTRTSLFDIISPPNESEKETYEFQDELEAINELNKTIHDIEASFTSNETTVMDTNVEHSLTDNAPTLHNDALSHKNPLDTQDLENKVELIEILSLDISNEENIKGDISKEKISKPTYAGETFVEATTLANKDTKNESTLMLVETQTDNVSTSISAPINPKRTSVTDSTSTIPSNDKELQYDGANEGSGSVSTEETTTITNLLSLEDDKNIVDTFSTEEQTQNHIDEKEEHSTQVNGGTNNNNNHLQTTTVSEITTKQSMTSPSTKTTIPTTPSTRIEERENIELGETFDTNNPHSFLTPSIANDTNELTNNDSRNTVFDYTTTGAPIEISTTLPPLMIEAVVAESEEEVQTTTEQEIFNETTTETHLEQVSNAAPLPIFIPHEIDEEKIFHTEAVISEEKPAFTLEEHKEFIYTTTLPPSTTEPEIIISHEDESIGEPKFEIEAVVAEEEDNRNEDGTFIETTTVSLRKLAANKIGITELSEKEDTPYSQIVDIRQSSNVNGPLDLETIADKPDADSQTGGKFLEKLTRKEDLDVEVDDDILGLQKLSDEEVASDVPPTDEKLDVGTPGSLLTKFIDGFFVPKQKNKPQKKKKNPNKAFTSIRVISEKDSDDKPNDDTKKEDVPVPEKDKPFPVSDILNGIYKLVSNFVTSKPKESVEDNEPTTTTSIPINFQQPEFGPINVHNMPRDQLIVEFLHEDNSPSDPFFQMQAPNLREEIPPNAEGHDPNIPAFPVKPNPPRAITLSPFNSPALKVQDPPKISDTIVAGPLPLNAPIERLYPEGFVGDVARPSTVEDSAPPLPFLPGNFLRGGQPSKPIPFSARPSQTNDNLPEEPSQSAFLALRNSNQRTRDPINIPLLPDLINEGQEDERPDAVFRRFSDIQQVDPVESLRNSDSNFVNFLGRQSSSFKEAFFGPIKYEHTQTSRSKRQLDNKNEDITLLDNELDTSEDQAILQGEENQVKVDGKEESLPSNPDGEDEAINCNWNIKTESDLYLLVTFHNLSAPFTVDCEGAYIEVERENNGFEARWCGNRVTQGGSRPHVIFAKNEVRISIFDDGSQGKDLPTGFSAEVEVIDLFDGQQYSNLRRSNAYSNVRKLTG